MKSLHWYSELRLENQKTQSQVLLSASVIEGVGKCFSVILPDGYKELIALHHGDSPLESHYSLQTPGGVMHGGIGMFLSPDPYVDENVFHLQHFFHAV